MKKMIKLLLIICISIPLVVDARLDYNDSVQYANNYIYNFKEYQDYIHLKNNTPYDYVNNKNEVAPNFQSGGFLSRKEYEISNIKGNSYLSNGLQYWTLTKSSYQKHYIVDYKLLEQFDTNLSGVRITEYVKPDVSVVGTGSYGNPWSFEDLLSIHINSDNVIRGKVSSEECSNVNMRKESIHLNITGNRSKAFYICPEEGYKFLKSTCSKYITNHSTNNMYTVDNLDRDNVICKVSYSYITKGITVKACSSCETAKTDKTIYVNNTHKIFLKDIDGTSKTETITELPKKTGYTFKGYYTSETDYIEENKIIDNLGNLKYNEQLNTKNKVYPYMKANEYTIKYNCNGGNGTTDDSHHIYDVETNLTSNNCKRTGYKFEGWATTSTGSKVYNDKKNVSNLSSVDGETVYLYAVWTKCPAGTYGSDGITCTKCIAGTASSATGATSIDTCVECNIGTYSSSGASNCSNCDSCYTNTKGSSSCPTLKTYTIKYEANEGSGAPSSQIKKCGIDLTLSQTKPTRKNYEFTGWASTDGTIYQPGGKYTSNKNDTLTAQWKALDTIAPTCSLAVSSDGKKIKAKYSDNEGGSGIVYYGWNSSYSGTKSDEKDATSGKHIFYVKDDAGNTKTCNVELSNSSKEIITIPGTCDAAAITYANQNSCNYKGGCNLYTGTYSCTYNTSTNKCDCTIEAFYAGYKDSYGNNVYYCCNCDNTWFKATWNSSIRKAQCTKSYEPTTKSSKGCSSDEFAYKYGWCAKYW